jgi:predicted RNase H-like HicB family nuclease
MDNRPISYLLWMLIKEAPDVPGEWLAICPKLGVVTQGSTPKQALSMGFEAVEMIWTHDIYEGKDPFAREDPNDPHTAEINALFEDSEISAGPIDAILEDYSHLRAAIAQIYVWAQWTHLKRPNAIGAKETNLMALAS